MKNWNGKAVKLVCEKTGVEKTFGDEVLSFRGDVVTINSMNPPHKESSSGFVNSKYAGVYGCKYVEA